MGKISYLEWMKYTYPMLLVQIPIVFGIVDTFTPSQKIMDSSIRKLKVRVARGTRCQPISRNIYLFY